MSRSARYYQEIKNDPERYAQYLARKREEARRRRGTSASRDRARTAEENVQYKREWIKARKEDLRVRTNAIKLASGCVDCGYNINPVALDFDHVTGSKDFNIASAIRSKLTWERIEAEIEKCVVRCANCHRVKTAQRREEAMRLNQLSKDLCK